MHWYNFDYAKLPSTPWKNGGGHTVEIARWPVGADFHDFLWRISIANIAGDGPFSAFAGVDRHIALLDGPGVHLHAPDMGIDHRLDHPLEPYSFPGEADLHCSLLGGPSNDFNVMVRRGRAQACLTSVRETRRSEALPFGLLFAVAGTWKVTAAHLSMRRLHAGQGAWWHDALPGQPLQAAPESDDAALLWLDIKQS